MKITPKNWKDFQHYSDRRPSWIKLHRDLLDNFEFHRLHVASRALAPMLWLLASESETGEIDADPVKLAFRLRMAEKDVTSALNPLIDGGFFLVVQDASNPLAEPGQSACLEKRREEREGASAPPASKAPSDARGHRLPEDFLLTPERREIAVRERLDPERTFRAFTNHWHASSGANARKRNWDRAWDNWCLRERKPTTAEKPANGIQTFRLPGA
jgi:hypothetical protein